MRNKIITSVFCLLLAVGVLSGILTPDKYYSESEKRTLKMQFPSPIFSAEKWERKLKSTLRISFL